MVTSSDSDGPNMATSSGDDGARWKLVATKDRN
jgi:hypothetical protein